MSCLLEYKIKDCYTKNGNDIECAKLLDCIGEIQEDYNEVGIVAESF